MKWTVYRRASRSTGRSVSRAECSHRRVMLALLAFIAAIGLFHGFASVVSAALEDRIENQTEWWGSLALTLNFVTMALLWRRWGLVATIGLQRAGR